jgi:hypothetical protein
MAKEWNYQAERTEKYCDISVGMWNTYVMTVYRQIYPISCQLSRPDDSVSFAAVVEWDTQVATTSQVTYPTINES